MKQPSRKMLQKWSDHFNDRCVIEEFLDWVESHCGSDALDFRRGETLDKFHGIDQKQLEKERRALLESIKL